MANTGIEMAEDTLEKLSVFGRTQKKEVRQQICKQDGVRQVCVEHVNHNPDSEAAFEELLELLTPECIRYVLFKAKFTTEDGRETEQMANFMWRGSKTKVASKMRYAGTFNTVKTSISTKMQHEYDSKAELTFEDICKRMM